MYEHIHKLYGRLPWADLFQPTIRLAREGVTISKIVARYLHLLKKSSVRELFEDEYGRLLKDGDTVKFERLADTLEVIAENGANEFYTGGIAQQLICDIKEAGGTLTMEDIRSVNVSEHDPWNVTLGNYTMYFPPPPAGAAVISFILNVMKGYNLTAASVQTEEDRALTFHRYVEALKYARARKNSTKDPEFNPGILKKAYEITEEEYADEIRENITDTHTHGPEYYTWDMDTVGTTHVSVLDEDGMAVAATSSINNFFGSKVLSRQTGIILNDHLADFCGKAVQVQTGERPPSSMAPMILRSTDNNYIVIGGSGGDMITTGVTMALMNYLWFGKSLEKSISDPVVYVDKDFALNFEREFDKEVQEALEKRNHTVKFKKDFYNVVNAVTKQDGVVSGYSDARKMGKAAGY